MNNYYFITYVTRRLGKQLFDKGMTKYDPIQTRARPASPQGLQDLDDQDLDDQES